MNSRNIRPEELEPLLRSKVESSSVASDPAHDLLHLERVVRTARALCIAERARLDVVIPAAWLHDLIVIPKQDPRRRDASKLSAQAACVWLGGLGVKEADLAEITHAIEAHSFSAGIPPKTLEAKIVQDADRLDALGAIGIARCFATGGQMSRPFYRQQDPFCESRPPTDQEFTVDHFYAKLLGLVRTLHTAAAQREGALRLQVMERYLTELRRELA